MRYIVQICMARYTSANFNSCWFYFCNIFFSYLSSIFHFQYYKPLVFCRLYQFNFQYAPKVIFSSLARRSRPFICSSGSLILVWVFNTHFIYHSSVTSRLYCFSLLSVEIYSLFKVRKVWHPSHIFFSKYFSIFISSLRPSKD